MSAQGLPGWNDKEWNAAFRDIPAREREMNQFPSTEWAVDELGPIMRTESEEAARDIARKTGASLYSRPPMGKWKKVEP